MANLITSQHYLNDEIVAAKIAAQDFEVLVSPAFEIDGQLFRVILDGNHSFAAAIEAGRDPEIVEATTSQHDAVALIERGEIEDFLAALWMDGEYIDARTHKAAW